MKQLRGRKKERESCREEVRYGGERRKNQAKVGLVKKITVQQRIACVWKTKETKNSEACSTCIVYIQYNPQVPRTTVLQSPEGAYNVH